jgi:hypothetical protein
MNLPIQLLLLILGLLLGGVALGALVAQFLQPATSILSPFLLIGLALLIAAVGYTVSVFRNPRK